MHTHVLSRLARVVAVVLAVLSVGFVASTGSVRAEPDGGGDVGQSSEESPSPTADPTAARPAPVLVLGLPDYHPGSLSEAETRTVYTQGELRMRQLNERLASQGVSPQDRAEIMVNQRNSLRTWARTLMSDRTLADELNTEDPNLTFADLVAKNQAKGLTGDDLYSAVIASATSSRRAVNDFLGIDPDNPPPLPPIRPPQPVSAGYPGPGETGS